MHAKYWHQRSPVMIEHKRIAQGKHRDFGLIAALLLAVTVVMGPRAACADDAVTLSLTHKDHKFDPAALHAPAGKPIDIRVKNLGDIVFEFESSELHFETIVPPGGEAGLHVGSRQPRL